MPLQLRAETATTTHQRDYVEKHDQPGGRETVKHKYEVSVSVTDGRERIREFVSRLKLL